MNEFEIERREPSLHKVNGEIFILFDYLVSLLDPSNIMRIALYIATPKDSIGYDYNTKFKPEDKGEEITDADLFRLWPHRVFWSKHGKRSTDTILAKEFEKRGYFFVGKKWIK